MTRTCKNCHEPLESDGWLHIDGQPVAEKGRWRLSLPSADSLCFECRMAARNWQPDPDEDWRYHPSREYLEDREAERKHRKGETDYD